MKKLISRRFLIVAIVAISSIQVRSENSLDQRETDLYEKMRDLLALTKGGITYIDYLPHVSELTILADRYVRTGGSSLGLSFAAKNFVDAKKNWERLNDRKSRLTPARESSPEIREIEQKIVLGQEQQIQLDWSAADRQLTAFEAEKKASKKQTPGKQQKPVVAPSRTQNAPKT